MAIELNARALARLPAAVERPRYDRRSVRPGMVHLGVGGFHRSHQALYADDLLQAGGDHRWGIAGAGLLAADARMRDAMRAQDNLYTLVERGGGRARARVIGSIVDYFYGPEDPEALLERMAAPETRLLTLTITEGGYYLHGGTGEFDSAHPDIRRELERGGAPSCSFGYVIEALERRRRRGLAPFAVLSCDNIPGNGAVARRMLLAFAELKNPILASWLSRHGAFPNCMVDRITPSTTDELRATVRDRFGVDDRWPVMAEPFRQWVIEDNFPLGRPEWEKVGVQMTADVQPYEKMKLRLLNASHQALCYAGILLGLELVHQTMGDPDLRELVVGMMAREVAPVLAPVPGIDLADYQRTLIERFSNPDVRDQLSRIATYGSAGLPKFLLPSLEDQLNRGGEIRRLSFVIACWFRYLRGSDDRGRTLEFRDPAAAALQARMAAGGWRSLLDLRTVFGEALASAPRFLAAVDEHNRRLEREGTRSALQAAVAGE